MSTPYRSEIDALQQRKAALEQEVADVDVLIDETKKRRLTLLDQVAVASPCSASWTDMIGDERVRYCLSCEKNVYNLSALPRAQAERLLEERTQGEVCVRYYQRIDGTIMTSDCPVGVKKKRRKKIVLAVVGAGAMALGVTGLQVRQATVMGKMSVQPPLPVTQVVEPLPAPTVPPPSGQWVAGGLRPMPQPAPEPTTVTTVNPPRPKAVPRTPTTR